ncbi:MAG: flagellar biosynthesis anti-sigma factor FlgM [Acidobacteriaceae bacterium]|jgi:negative regulator of flagellin synthesis FlgM
MSLTNGIGDNLQPSDAITVGTAVGTSGAARIGAAPRSPWPASGPAGEIAMDTAKVSLAGAMISQATQGSDVRFDKVAALQQAINAGTYNVSSASLADKLISVLQR